MSDEDKAAGRGFYEQAKAAADDPVQCLKLMQQAYARDPRKKYLDKIIHLQEIIDRQQSESESSGDIIIMSKYKVVVRGVHGINFLLLRYTKRKNSSCKDTGIR
jgi:hypothetical protein